jgi:UrcA family protein
MTRLSPFAFAAAMVATSATVLFASPSQAAEKRVAYSDLDLATAAGRATLDRRIGSAAQSVCWIENGDIRATATCRRESVAAAHKAVQSAMRSQAVELAAR